ncbi:cytochrome b562 [Thalassotalea ponticola]|uniref:cytochrome b562 n=1 Tax=Thalassotalea ponticola TaxID=1523392 RepID=UPI0025B54B6E|nr:cytochrome b562 [Thalassotalea ponticola]MDN3653488.1 cytochrome b562 [Thalassotalea ponticola]
MIKPLLVASLLTATTMSSAFAAHPMCGETELAAVMNDMKDNMKTIKQSFKAGNTAQVKQAAEELLSNIGKTDSLVPLSISDDNQLTAEQKRKFEQYQRGMATLEQATTELINANDSDAIKQALANIGKVAKKGHKAFKLDCDD